MVCPWLAHSHAVSLAAQTSVDLLSPGTSGVCGNKRADRLASTANITSGLHGMAEVLRGLRNFLNMDKPEHHSTDCLKE